jgi:amino acid transporter
MKALPSRYVAWVTAAFGPFWGFQEGWWSWLSGVTDNSVYPVLFLTYLDAVVPGAGLCPVMAFPGHTLCLPQIAYECVLIVCGSRSPLLALSAIWIAVLPSHPEPILMHIL